MSETTNELEPRLLSTDELKHRLNDKGVHFETSWSRDDLVDLYIKFVQPKPQRSNRSKTLTTATSSTTRNTRLSENQEIVGCEKRLKTSNSFDLVNTIRTSLKLSQESRQSSEEAMVTSPTLSPTKKIVLKRTRIETPTRDTETDSNDEIKKAKTS